MLYTYPCTCPNPKEPVTSKERVINSQYWCQTVGYTEDEQQNTNNNVCNGEESDHRHQHFEAQINETLETQYLHLRQFRTAL